MDACRIGSLQHPQFPSETTKSDGMEFNENNERKLPIQRQPMNTSTIVLNSIGLFSPKLHKFLIYRITNSVELD